MRAKDLIFHIHCFCCTLCKIPLSAGDTAMLQNGQLYCGDHVEQQLAPLTDRQESPVPSHSFFCTSPQKGRPRKRKCSPHGPSSIGLTLTHPSLLLLDQGNRMMEAMDSRSGGIDDTATELRLGEFISLLFIFRPIIALLGNNELRLWWLRRGTFAISYLGTRGGMEIGVFEEEIWFDSRL